jgi:hypothetical protein
VTSAEHEVWLARQLAALDPPTQEEDAEASRLVRWMLEHPDRPIADETPAC